MRIVCPDCKNAILLDDADAGFEVECPRCRGTIRAPSREGPDPRDERRFEPAGPPGRGRAITALVLGLLSVPGAACCGLGGLLGLAGFVMAATSFRSPGRASAITGAVFSVIGMTLSLGVLMLFNIVQSTMTRPVPPGADGFQPPFAKKL